MKSLDHLCLEAVSSPFTFIVVTDESAIVIYQVHPSGEYISVMILPTQHLLFKACLPWWPPFSQHILVVVVEPSEYSVFYDRNTPIQLSLLWQSHTPVSVLPLKPLLVLQSIPQECIMEMGRGYNNMIGCTKAVSVSTLCRRCWNLILFSCTVTHLPHGLCIVSSLYTSIYTLLYLYALPIITSLYFFSSLCLSATWALS